MKIFKLTFVTTLMAVGTMNAAASEQTLKSDPPNSTQSAYSQSYAKTQTRVPQYDSSRKVRVIREPVPRQSRVLRQTSRRGLVVTPHHAAGAVKIIPYDKKGGMNSSMRNLYSD
ncbi:hypothetical protein LIHA111178_12420 [Litorimonas haliclonae]